MEIKDSNQRMESILRSLARFSSNYGLDYSLGNQPDLDLIESYVIKGLDGRSSSTKGTYSSLLCHGFETRPNSIRFKGSIAGRSYSPAERSALLSMVNGQNKSWRRFSGLAMLSLGIGAGIRAIELSSVKGSDLKVTDNGVFVNLGVTQKRQVQLHSPWDKIALSIKGEDKRFLFKPEAAYRGAKNFINRFTDDLTRDNSCPKLQLSRTRSSYISDLFDLNVGLEEILRSTGILEVESLIRYVGYIRSAPQTKAELRHQLNRERK